MENRLRKVIVQKQKVFFSTGSRAEASYAGTYYELPIGREKPSSVGFDYSVLSAEPKLHCKPVKL